MNKLPSVLPVVVSALVCAVALATPARALAPGEQCTLKSPLMVTIQRPSGTIESTLDIGAVVELLSLSDNGYGRILAGDVKGIVSFPDLQSACTGTLRRCVLGQAVMMYEQNRSDSRSWRVKPGADVSVLKKGKTWAAVRVGDVQGFVLSDDIANCTAMSTGPARGDGETAPEGPTEAVERGDGPGLLLLPFGLDGAAPTGAADAFLDQLYERAAYYRPDAGRLGVEAGGRDKAWKDNVKASAKRARGAETAYVLVGQLAVEPPTKEAPLEERYLLQLAVVDTKTSKVLKGVRIRPTTRAEDTWADKALGELLPALAAAPGSRLPAPATGPKLELAPNPGAALGPATKKAEATPESPTTPWFANGWGYAMLATAAAAGVGGGLLGQVAVGENDVANASKPLDAARTTHRNTALAEAITADSLTVVAVGTGVAGIVVFATRAGLD